MKQPHGQASALLRADALMCNCRLTSVPLHFKYNSKLASKTISRLHRFIFSLVQNNNNNNNNNNNCIYYIYFLWTKTLAPAAETPIQTPPMSKNGCSKYGRDAVIMLSFCLHFCPYVLLWSRCNIVGIYSPDEFREVMTTQALYQNPAVILKYMAL